MEHGGDIYTDGLLKNKNLIDFSSNINPLGMSQNIKKNINCLLENAIRYPDFKYRLLKQGIIEYIKSFENTIIDYNNILLGNGSIEIIDLITSTLNSISIVVPSFIEYELIAKKYNLKIDFVNLNNNMEYNYELIKKSLKNTNSIILGNPNNPTGNIIDIDMFKDIIIFCQNNNKKIVVDEAFVEFTNCSILNQIKNYDCLFVIRAITKFFGVPGARLGYCISSNTNFLNQLLKKQLIWNINCFAEFTAINSFKDIEYINNTKLFIKQQINYMFKGLNSVDLFERVYNTNCNFILCKLKNYKSSQLYSEMLNKNILIRKCDNFRGLNNKYVRFAIKTQELNNILINCLKAIRF